MKIRILKKIFIFLFVFSTLLYVGTFLRFDKVHGNPYDQYYTWNGFDLDYQAVNPTAFSFESKYKSFSDIINVANPQTIDTSKIYVIESAMDLYYFSALASGTNDLKYLSLNYVLGKDIDYFDALLVSFDYLFIPIGFNNPFTGTFDGQGFEITNLILRTVNTTSEYDTYMPGLVYLSMFSKIHTTGVIKNFGLINPLIIQPLEQGVMTHVSIVAGENKGLIENVYYIDLREDSAGINAEGFFHISGFVSRNSGQIKNSFISTPYVKSQAITNNISTNVLVYHNTGSISNLYYDQEVLQDLDALTTTGVGLLTAAFQNPAIFNSTWYFKESYVSLAAGNPSLVSQFMINKTYPDLQGLEISGGKLLIKDAIGFIYMNALLKLSGQFRQLDYVITHDIDMNQVAKNSYKAADVGFSGSLSSNKVLSSSTTLYNRHANQGGDISYHTIIDLKIAKTTFIGNYASYGIFSSLFGTVENLNIYNMKINTTDIDTTFERTKILIGSLAGQLNHATIHNVHVDVDINIQSSSKNLGQVLVAGLGGEGSATIVDTTTHGSITSGLLFHNSKSDHSAVSSMVAKSSDLDISKSLAHMDITGLSYSNTFTGTNYIGSIVGYGTLKKVEKVVNLGDVLAYQNGQVDTLYVAGMFGRIHDVELDIAYVYNQGRVSINADQTLGAYVNGVGFFKDIEDNLEISSATNAGILDIKAIGTLSQATLQNINIYVSGVLTISETKATVHGIYQTRNQNLDLSLIDNYSGLLMNIGTKTIDLTKAYQEASLTLTSSHLLTNPEVKIAGLVLGTNLNMTHLRNEGNININYNHASMNFTNGNFYVYGIFEEVSLNHFAKEIVQLGNINVTDNQSGSISYNTYISGVAGSHKDTNIYSKLNYNHTSINITDKPSSFDTVLNKGNISFNGAIRGHVRIAGIVLFNRSLLTNAINLGDIYARNDVVTAGHEVETSGVVYLMSGSYAQIKDSANNGEIKAISNTANGAAHAAGIALRNDRLENGNDITANATTNYYAKVMFSINYGDIYAYNNFNENSYTVANETRSKAAGIIAIGVLSGINNANYGNVYSRYLAAGIIGLIDYQSFGTIPTTPKRVFISNSINYGLVRNISTYDANNNTFTINQTPQTALPYQLGAIVGKIHTGTSNWEFIGNNAIHPINAVYFGYLLNFDERLNMFGQAPPPASASFNNSEQLFNLFNEEMSDMMINMATINPNDQSAAPFRQFNIRVNFFGWFGVDRAFSRQITSYTLSEAEEGIFNENFGFRRSRPVFGSTDQYIRDYIQYIPRDKVSNHLLNKLDQNVTGNFAGIYALSSSKGIGNGIFIPDGFETLGLNKYSISHPLGDDAWISDQTQGTSVSEQLYTEMRQIKNAFATTIYDLEIMQVAANGTPIQNGLKLSNPVIDDQKGLLTYYIPSNAQVLGTQTPSSVTASRFIEVTQDGGMSQADFGARHVPNEVGSGAQQYTWVGTHKLNPQNNNMVPIGPYKIESGKVYNITNIGANETVNRLFSPPTPPRYEFDQAPDARGTNVINQVAKFAGYTGSFIYTMTGHSVTQQEVSAGQGAYRLAKSVTFPGYSTNVLTYVGPSTEATTYVNSGLTENVIVYPNSNVYFNANTQTDSFVISDGATLEVLLTKPGTPNFDPKATVPRSFGIYTQLYHQNGDYIDSVEDHYGEVRVKSQAYNQTDSSTYKDYKIRVIRTANQSITDVLALTVNGTSALPSNYNVNSITAQVALWYNVNDTQGTLSLRYETYNLADEYYLVPLVEIFDNNTSLKVHTSFYDIQQGYVQTAGGFESATGNWGTGEVTLEVVPGKDFPSGNYRMETKLVTGQKYTLYFSKLESGNLNVLSLTFNNEVIEPESNLLVSEIPFGLYYMVQDPSTHMVNFTNLASITNVYYTDVNSQLPSYLTDLDISNFTTIVSINLNISKIDGYRYQYDIIYNLKAENGSLGTFTHRLIERTMRDDVMVAYKNGSILNLPLAPIEIYYEEGPTLRMEYDFVKVFFPSDHVLSVASTFVPLNGTDQAFENQDYFIQTINSVGYEVDLNVEVPKGTYTYTLNYKSEKTLWGVNFDWDFTFDTIVGIKLKNDNAHLTNILFATNSVFDEIIDAFSTILEYDEITVADYEGYYAENPEDRTQRLMNVLPTTGIDYGVYGNYQAYWILGQVQRTNLSSYKPTFYVPDGAEIYKVTNPNELHYSFQSSELTGDYSDFGDGIHFNFIHYRVYAEDFDENPSHYVDYYVTVQDTTNNVKIDIKIVNDTEAYIEEVYVMVNVCQIAQGETCDLANYKTSMTLFSYFDQESLTYINLPFATSTDGVYKIVADVPKGFDFYIEASPELITGDYLTIPSSRIPQRYYITIHVAEALPGTPNWGYDESYHYQAQALPLDFLRTYTAGERFTFNDVTYKVQQGYTYTYSVGQEPGTSPLLGLLKTNRIYDTNSTYVNGDTVFYLDAYYKALGTNASGVIPNITSVSSGVWFEISLNWLSYNYYQTGDIIDYNGVYYQALMTNQGYTPNSNPGIWEVYLQN